MKGLAHFVMAGRWQAVFVTAGFALVGLFAPLFGVVASLFSSAALALVTLRIGAMAGLQLMGMGLSVLAGMTWAVWGQPQAGLMLGLGLWLPIWLASWLLRVSLELRVTLLGILVLGVLTVLGLHLVLADLPNYWREVLLALLAPLQQEGLAQGAQFQAAVTEVARLMTGIVVAGVTLATILGLFLARAWQAQLYHPGGFARELQALQLGRAIGGLSLLLLAVAMVFKSHLGLELALVVLTALFIQGVVLVHVLNTHLGAGKGWLAAFYFFLLIAFPQVSALVAAVGIGDCFLDIRSRILAKDKHAAPDRQDRSDPPEGDDRDE